MYVAVTGKGHSRVIQFVEQHRIPNTDKKKTVVIKTLGNYEKMLAENPNIIEELKVEAKELTQEKREKLKPLTISYLPKEINSEDDALLSFHFGHTVLEYLWKDLELDKFFKKEIQSSNRDRLISAIKNLLFHRMLKPSSILSTYNNIDNFAGLSSDYIDLYYNALDSFDECSDKMIDYLCKKFEKNTERNTNIAYYDVTTYAFESVRTGELRLFGFSKDHKNNEVQVVMGLLIDSQGIPISYTLFPGNTMDQTTLEEAVKDLRKRYNMEKIVIVADRGLNSKDNLYYLIKEGHDFVMSYTLKKSPKELQALSLSEEDWIEKYEGKELVYKSKIIDYTLDVRRLLTEEEKKELTKRRGRPKEYTREEIPVKIHITWDKKRAEKDEIDRRRILEKVKEDLKTPSKIRAQAKRGRSQYVNYEADFNSASLDEDRIAYQAQFDGYYAVITNKIEISTEEVTRIYGGLWQIEESFRIIKSDLETRPVYVWTDPHIRGHFSMCYLGLCLYRYLQYKLLKDGYDYSVAVIRDSLYKAIVLVQGEFPEIKLSPTKITKEFLNIINSLEISKHKLYTYMSLSEFKRATKLDLTTNL